MFLEATSARCTLGGSGWTRMLGLGCLTGCSLGSQNVPNVHAELEHSQPVIVVVVKV